MVSYDELIIKRIKDRNENHLPMAIPVSGFSQMQYNFKVDIDCIYKLKKGLSLWFIELQDNFILTEDKYVILKQMDAIHHEIGFGYFVNEYGVVQEEINVEFSIKDLEFIADDLDRFNEEMNEKRQSQAFNIYVDPISMVSNSIHSIYSSINNLSQTIYKMINKD